MQVAHTEHGERSRQGPQWDQHPLKVLPAPPPNSLCPPCRGGHMPWLQSRPSCPRVLFWLHYSSPSHFLSEPQLWLPSAHHAVKGSCPGAPVPGPPTTPGANPARLVRGGCTEKIQPQAQKRPPILPGEAAENSPLNRRDPEASPEEGGGAGPALRPSLQSSAVQVATW